MLRCRDDSPSVLKCLGTAGNRGDGMRREYPSEETSDAYDAFQPDNNQNEHFK